MLLGARNLSSHALWMPRAVVMSIGTSWISPVSVSLLSVGSLRNWVVKARVMSRMLA